MSGNDPIGDFFAHIEQEEEQPKDPVGKTYPGSRHLRRESPRPETQTDVDWEKHAQYKAVGGRRIELFPIGALAAALQRTPATIRLWTRKGYLPQASYRLPGYEKEDGTYMPGRRFYLRPMIECAVELFRERDLLNSDRVEWKQHPELPGQIHQMWSDLYQQFQSEEKE